MIDPKYADLPGIAYDQPDIYETDDNAELEHTDDSIQEEGDAVEKVYVSASDAFHKFKDKYVDSKNIDFSDTILDKRKIGYNFCGSGQGYPDNSESETPFQKFYRLKQEIGELVNYFHSKQENIKEVNELEPLTDLIYQVENTEKELDTMNIHKLLTENSTNRLSDHRELRFKELKAQIRIFKQKAIAENISDRKEIVEEQQGSLKYQMIYFPDKAKIQDVARLSNFEKRLNYLESMIGFSNDVTVKRFQILKSQGLIESVENLIENICLLNSTQLDILEIKAASLINKMDRIIQRKPLALEDSKQDKIVAELFDIIKRNGYSSQILDRTIDRLLSLRDLHQKAAECISQIQELEDLQRSISRSVIININLLNGMQKNFGSNLEVIATDITLLNERVKNLQQ